MAREVATSREVATREVADRSNGLYIKENDWMLWMAVEKTAYIEIANMGELFNYLPITISYRINSFFVTSGTVLSIYNADHSSRVYAAANLSFSYNPVLSPAQLISLIYDNNSYKKTNIYVDNVITISGGKGYVNGELASSATWTGAASQTVIDSDRSLLMNIYPGILNNNRQYMSHFEIWHKELSAVEISEKYNNYAKGEQLSGTEDGLVCYFPIQEGSGNLITDIVGGKTGVINGAEWRDYGGLREAA